MAETVITFLLALGATARLTRLGAQDALTAPVRAWLASRASPGPDASDSSLTGRPAASGRGGAVFVSRLLECSWCLSVWVAAAVGPLAYFFGTTPAFRIPALVLLLSYLTGLLAKWFDSDIEPAQVVHHFPSELRIRSVSTDGPVFPQRKG